MGDPKEDEPGQIRPISINEPPGSRVNDPPPEIEPEAQAAPDVPELPSDSAMTAMTRAELDELADSYGLDSTGLATKADVIAYLHANVG